MLEWLKTILGDAYTPEIETAVSQEIGKGFVSRTDFNTKAAKVTELEAQVGQLMESAKTYTAQLAELKKSAGDTEALTKKITEMEEQAKTDKANYEKELARVKLLSAVDTELAAAGSKNNTAVRAVLAEFLKEAKIVDGKVTSKEGTDTVTLAAKVEALKKDASTDFLFGTTAKYAGWKPGEGSVGALSGGKEPKDMTYDELCAYLAENPDAKL